MLPKINRLKQEKDFEQLFKKGKGFNNNLLFLKIIRNNLTESRFGIIVSQKVSKKASVRNKVKRRIRAAVQKNLSKIKKGFDVAIVAFPGISSRNFIEIEKDLLSLFRKAKIIT